MATRAREVLAVLAAMWRVRELRAHRPRRAKPGPLACLREALDVAPLALRELRRRAAGDGVATRGRTGDVTARRAQLRAPGRERMTARARQRVLAVIERGTELGGVGRQPIGDERPPRLG